MTHSHTGSAEVSGSVIVDGLLQSGVGHTNSSTDGSNVLVGGDTHVISSGVQRSGMFAGWDSDITSGNASAIIAGGAHTSTANYGAIVGGESNSISGNNSVVIGGTNNNAQNTCYIFGGTQHYANGANSTVVGGSDNDISNGTNDAIFGGANNDTFGGGTLQQTIVGGQGNIIQGAGNSRNITTLGGQSNTLRGEVSRGVIIGGFTNKIGQHSGNNGQAEASFIIGGRYNNIGEGSSTAGYNADYSAILNNSGSDIDSGSFQAMFNGANNFISGSQYATIIGSQGSTISGHNNSAVIGGSGLSTSKDNEVVVPDLSVYGETFISSSTLGTGSLIDNLGQQAIVTGSQVQHIVNLSQAEYDALTPDDNTLYVIDGSETLGDTVVSGSLIGEVSALSIASTTASMDCSAGNYFTLTLANGVDTHLDATNIAAGQTINLKLTNNATAAGTISFAPEFEFEGGTAFTATAATNAVDVLTFVSFDGTSLQTVGVKNFS